jgi:hypothetical protein
MNEPEPRSPIEPAHIEPAGTMPPRPPLLVRLAVILVIAGFTIFQRFGVSLGSSGAGAADVSSPGATSVYSIDVALIAQYLLVGSLFVTGSVHLNKPNLILFVPCLLIASASCLLNIQDASYLSLALLVVAYSPFILSARPRAEINPCGVWALRMFSNFALFCAASGIVQFAAQFVIHQPWLFDFTEYIPEAIRGSGTYNTVIPVGTGSFSKSNGFFFREPSMFSQITALALIAEFALLRRFVRIGILSCALVLSYSGTGIGVLLIALMFPLGVKSVVRMGVLATLGALAIGTAIGLMGDSVHLGATLDRVREFNSAGSSGFARFVAPFLVVWEAISVDSWAVIVGHAPDAWSTLLGYGPGTIARSIARNAGSYEINDPTWAKLTFEYGLLGLACFTALVLRAINQSHIPIAIRAALFSTWLIMGGYLLTPQVTAQLYVLAALWPVSAPQRQESRYRARPVPPLPVKTSAR